MHNYIFQNGGGNAETPEIMWKGDTDNNWVQNQWENNVDSQERPLNNQENEQKQMSQQDSDDDQR